MSLPFSKLIQFTLSFPLAGEFLRAFPPDSSPAAPAPAVRPPTLAPAPTPAPALAPAAKPSLQSSPFQFRGSSETQCWAETSESKFSVTEDEFELSRVSVSHSKKTKVHENFPFNDPSENSTKISFASEKFPFHEEELLEFEHLSKLASFPVPVGSTNSPVPTGSTNCPDSVHELVKTFVEPGTLHAKKLPIAVSFNPKPVLTEVFEHTLSNLDSPAVLSPESVPAAALTSPKELNIQGVQAEKQREQARLRMQTLRDARADEHEIALTSLRELLTVAGVGSKGVQFVYENHCLFLKISGVWDVNFVAKSTTESENSDGSDCERESGENSDAKELSKGTVTETWFNLGENNVPVLVAHGFNLQGPFFWVNHADHEKNPWYETYGELLKSLEAFTLRAALKPRFALPFNVLAAPLTATCTLPDMTFLWYIELCSCKQLSELFEGTVSTNEPIPTIRKEREDIIWNTHVNINHFVGWIQSPEGRQHCENAVASEAARPEEDCFFVPNWSLHVERTHWMLLPVAQRAYAKCYWESRTFSGLADAPADVANTVWSNKLSLPPDFRTSPKDFPQPERFRWLTSLPTGSHQVSHLPVCSQSYFKPVKDSAFESRVSCTGYPHNGSKTLTYGQFFWNCDGNCGNPETLKIAIKTGWESHSHTGECNCTNIVALRRRKNDGILLPDDLEEFLARADRKARSVRNRVYRDLWYEFYEDPKICHKKKVLASCGVSGSGFKQWLRDPKYGPLCERCGAVENQPGQPKAWKYWLIDGIFYCMMCRPELSHFVPGKEIRTNLMLRSVRNHTGFYDFAQPLAQYLPKYSNDYVANKFASEIESMNKSVAEYQKSFFDSLISHPKESCPYRKNPRCTARRVCYVCDSKW